MRFDKRCASALAVASVEALLHTLALSVLDTLDEAELQRSDCELRSMATGSRVTDTRVLRGAAGRES
jgi:hypothetical protein